MESAEEVTRLGPHSARRACKEDNDLSPRNPCIVIRRCTYAVHVTNDGVEGLPDSFLVISIGDGNGDKELGPARLAI
jgi:hypothetical protein